MRQVSPHAATPRRNQTDVEQRLWLAVRDRRLDGFKFRRQATIGRYVVDFLCVSARLVVELDGGQHEATKDAPRTAFLEAQGYRVLRFWNNDVIENMEGVLAVIHAALKEEVPSPNQHQVNIAPRCLDHAGGMIDLMLPQAGEG